LAARRASRSAAAPIALRSAAASFAPPSAAANPALRAAAAACTLLAVIAAPAPAGWERLNGPDPAVASCLVAHDGALFLGSDESDQGDIFRSTDGGQNWTNVGGANPGTTLLFSHPGGLFASFYLAGLHRSTDAGETWNPVGGGLPPSFQVQAMAASGANVFAAGLNVGSDRVQRSTDNGATWGSLPASPTHSYWSLLAAGSTVLAGTDGAGLQRSADLGAGWAPATGIPANATVTALGAHAAAFYAAARVAGNPAANGIYRSVDDGASWAKVSVDLPGEPWVRTLEARDGALLAALSASAGHGVYRSTDDGAHWTEISITLPVEDQALSLLVTEPDLIAGFETGVYRSTDEGATWRPSHHGTAAVRGVGALHAGGGALLVGLQTNGALGKGIVRTNDVGASWTVTGGLEINTTAQAFTEHAGALYAALYGYQRGVVRSTDGGLTWADASAGLSPASIFNAILSTGSALLLGEWDGLFRSTNSGASWSQIAGVPGVAALGSLDGAVYAGLLEGGVLRSTDGGANWAPWSAGLPAGHGISALAAHDGELFAAARFSGIYRLSGSTWSFAGLPGSYVNALHSAGGVLVAAEFEQSIQISANGSDWAPFIEGYPGEEVYELASDDAWLYAGTRGIGIWARPLNELPGGASVDWPPGAPVSAPSLAAIAPNPLRAAGTVRFELPAAAPVRLEVYDARGRVLRRENLGVLPGGAHTAGLDLRDLPSGVYFVRISSPAGTARRAVSLVR